MDTSPAVIPEELMSPGQLGPFQRQMAPDSWGFELKYGLLE